MAGDFEELLKLGVAGGCLIVIYLLGSQLIKTLIAKKNGNGHGYATNDNLIAVSRAYLVKDVRETVAKEIDSVIVPLLNRQTEMLERLNDNARRQTEILNKLSVMFEYMQKQQDATAANVQDILLSQVVKGQSAHAGG